MIQACFSYFTPQMFAAPPDELNRIVFRTQRKRLQIKTCRACRCQCRGEKGCFAFWHKSEKRCVERKQFKQMIERRIQSGCVPCPIITAATQRNLEWFHGFTSP